MAKMGFSALKSQLGKKKAVGNPSLAAAMGKKAGAKKMAKPDLDKDGM